MDAKLTKAERQVLVEASESVYWKSHYKFLSNHNGWRPGALHLFLGVSSGGKSTLTRSLIIDSLEAMGEFDRIGLWLSEESKKEFLTEFCRSGYDTPRLGRLFIESEIDLSNEVKTANDVYQKIKAWIEYNQISLLFFDNITTSQCYMDMTAKQQATVSKAFKKLAFEKEIPIVFIAHTGANITENYSGIIEMNDIRGGKTIVNLAQFFYIMQTFFVSDNRHTTLRVTKHRGQDVETRFHKLIYAKKQRIFAGDEEIKFAQLKELYKQRNRL